MRSGFTFLIIVSIILCAPALAYDWSTNLGDGSTGNPYQISEPEQLNSIGADPNLMDKWFILSDDIDLGGYTGTQYNIIGSNSQPFTGYFDGCGHTISNFTYTDTGNNYIGLFGYAGKPFEDSGQIRNLTLVNVNIDAGTGNHVGGIVGLTQGSIINCHVLGGSVQGGDNVGGLCGNPSYNVMANCHTTCNVQGDETVGGLAGRDGDLTYQCYATGDVTGKYNVGGLIGNQGGEINKCYALGDVVGLSGGNSVGGLSGIMYPDSSTYDSYARGAVTGNLFVGGLCGINWEGAVIHCYSTGFVTGVSTVGGLVGNNNASGPYVSCFWDTQSSGQLSGAGAGSESGIVGLETAFMQIESTFSGAGWDFTTPIWTITEGMDYPALIFGEYVHDYGGGSGLPNDPFLIYTAEHMQELGSKEYHWGMYFKLMDDIDLSGYDGQGDNPAFRKIGYNYGSTSFVPFTGTFDGNGHTISNLTYTESDAGMIGLFGYAQGSGVVIKNLGLINPSVHATDWNQQVGALVGLFRDGLLTDCYVQNGDVSGDTLVGALVGRLVQGTIAYCQASGTVSGSGNVGGLLGNNDEGEVFDCDANTSVTATDWSSGGLVGDNTFGTISGCTAAGHIIGVNMVGGLVGSVPMELGGQSRYGIVTNCAASTDVEGVDMVGGLVGANNGDVSRCYATGSVAGDENVGGLIGSNSNTLTDSYATGSATGGYTVGGLIGMNYGFAYRNYSTGPASGTQSPIGGMVGYNWGGIVEDLFWDTQTSGLSNMCGDESFDGVGCDDSAGKTTLVMKSYQTFIDSDWDFVGESANGENDIWRMCVDDIDYPRLSWEFAQYGDFACGDGVDILDLQVLAQNWLTAADITPATFNHACDANGDGQIDLLDYAVLGENWQ